MTEDSKRVAQSAKDLYERDLRVRLEHEHLGEFLFSLTGILSI
jgi:hypothetical protein